MEPAYLPYSSYLMRCPLLCVPAYPMVWKVRPRARTALSRAVMQQLRHVVCVRGGYNAMLAMGKVDWTPKARALRRPAEAARSSLGLPERANVFAGKRRLSANNGSVLALARIFIKVLR
jgi:hypothetical protein